MTVGADLRELDVIVVCNGCTDDLASRAASLRELVSWDRRCQQAHAMNLGDQAAYERVCETRT
jgi:hypothetical protein